MPRENRTRWTILGCLTIEPMSGYDVKRFIDRTIVHFWNESYGQLYPTLKALEEEGLATSRLERQESRPDRRVYSITDEGRRALAEWLALPAEPPVPRYEHSLKLFFGANARLSVSLERLERMRRAGAEALRAYHEKEKELEARLDEWPHAPYWLAVLRGGIRYAEMGLDWCDETEALLREHAADAPEAPRTVPMEDSE